MNDKLWNIKIENNNIEATKFVLNKLNLIQHGSLKLINYDGKVYHFGDLENSLCTDIKINNPNFYFNIIVFDCIKKLKVGAITSL